MKQPSNYTGMVHSFLNALIPNTKGTMSLGDITDLIQREMFKRVNTKAKAEYCYQYYMYLSKFANRTQPLHYLQRKEEEQAEA